ncbi:MAG: AMP-binding protein [Spirochaetota bacterium]
MLKETLVDLVAHAVRENWDLPAVSDHGGSGYTYGEMGRMMLMLHHLFDENGVHRGDSIALVGRNSAAWGIAYLAVVSYGAVIVPILPDFHPDDMHHIVNHSDSVFVFASDDIIDKLDPGAMKRVRGIFSLTDFSLRHHARRSVADVVHKAVAHFKHRMEHSVTKESFTLPKADNARLAAILYTSGTTGFSKGVMLPLLSLSSNVVFGRNNFSLVPGDTTVAFLPVAHVFGCAFDFLFPITCGCHINFLAKIPSPKIVIEAFAAVKPRIICTVPLVIEKIYARQIKPMLEKAHIRILTQLPFVKTAIHSAIRARLVKAFGGKFYELIIGGAALNEEVEAFLHSIDFPYTVGYGMTECGPIITYSDFKYFRPRSVGRTVERMEVKIDSADPAATAGEILVRGENVTSGYYKDKETTKDSFTKDGWMRTGDLGIMDSEGNVFIRGRSKTMMLGPSGQNIYPEEIEAKLNYLPYVQESIVIERDNKLVALVYPDYEKADAEGLDERGLTKKMDENLKLLAKRLPAFITVSRIELYPEEFEKTPKRSIKRFLYTRN